MRKLAAALVVSAIAVSGCSGEAPRHRSLDRTDLEREVSDQLEAHRGQAPDSVTCPGDLAAVEGTTMRCVLRNGSDDVGVTVTVAGLHEGIVDLGIDVDKD